MISVPLGEAVRRIARTHAPTWRKVRRREAYVVIHNLMCGCVRLVLFALFTQVSGLAIFAAEPTDPSRQGAPASDLARLQFTRFVRAPLRLSLRYAEIRDGKLVVRTPSSKALFKDLIQKDLEPTQTLGVGDYLPESDYVITSITPKIRMNERTGIQEDVSEIGLRNSRTRSESVITMGKISDSPDIVALLVSSEGHESFSVRVGDKFAYPEHRRINYEVLQIQPTHLILLRLATGERFRIPRQQRTSGANSIQPKAP